MKKLMCAAAFALSLSVSGVSAAGPAGWDTFCPEGEKFSISFPGAPVSITKDAKTPAGDLHMTMYMDTTDSVTYQLGVIELPEGLGQMVSKDPETLLKGFALGFTKVARGEL